MWLAFSGLTILSVYIIIMIILCKGIPSSVSETFYSKGGYWFTVVLFASMFLLGSGMFIMSEVDTTWQFLSFISAAGLGFVGAAPRFREHEGIIHYVGATLLILGSQIWICIYSNPWILMLWISTFMWIQFSRRTFWCEVVTIVTMYVALWWIAL